MTIPQYSIWIRVLQGILVFFSGKGLDFFIKNGYNNRYNTRGVRIPRPRIQGGAMANRISKHNYYLDIAQTVSERSTCLRKRYGAIIVKNDSILSTGYNGAPRGRLNCDDIGVCLRNKLEIPSGERYELCRSVHSEANAIIAAAREDMLGSTLYMCCTDPKDGSIVAGTNSCSMCKRLIINAGIKTVIIRETKTDFTTIETKEWIGNDDSLESLIKKDSEMAAVIQRMNEDRLSACEKK